MSSSTTRTGAARPALEILSAADIRRIHEATLDVIERVGVRFPSARAQAIWAEHGATVDRATGVVAGPRRGVSAESLRRALGSVDYAVDEGIVELVPAPDARA